MTSTRPATRHTWQRAAIRDLLEGGEEFRTAQQLHDQLREVGAKVGLATVYRTLQGLVDAVEVDAVRTPDGQVAYRACAGRARHHHHLICRSCGRTVELELQEVEGVIAALAARHGFSEVQHELELYGVCSACATG